MFRELRASLDDEANCLYFLHTSQGEIEVEKFDYRVPGFVIVIGSDESKKQMVLVLNEQVICTLTLEVRPKSSSSTKRPVGFKLAKDNSTKA